MGRIIQGRFWFPVHPWSTLIMYRLIISSKSKLWQASLFPLLFMLHKCTLASCICLTCEDHIMTQVVIHNPWNQSVMAVANTHKFILNLTNPVYKTFVFSVYSRPLVWTTSSLTQLLEIMMILFLVFTCKRTGVYDLTLHAPSALTISPKTLNLQD